MNDPKVAIPIPTPKAAAKPRPAVSVQLNPSHVYFTPPLVGCLSVVSRLLGRPVSATALEAGLPRTQEGMTPYAVIRAARREGIDAQITHKPVMDKISPLNMPCVLLMQDGSACVLVSLKEGQARIIMPENPDAPFDTPVEKLKETYSGHAVFARPKASLDSRTEGSRSSTPRNGSGAPSFISCPFTGT